MTGAGAATVAYELEDSFLGGVSTPSYKLPGTNVTVDEASIENFLTRIRDPNARESVRSVAGQFEGALSVSFNMGSATFNELIFNADDGSGNDILDSGLVDSAEWYLGTDFEDGGSISTVERVAKGWVCIQATIEWQQGGLVRVTLDGIYGDEDKNASITPGSITKPGDEAPFHAATLTLDSTTQAKAQSATISFSDLARFERGTDRNPIAAVAGPSPVTVDIQAIYTEADQLELAYGSAGSTTPQSSVGGVSGTFSFDVTGGSTVSSYDFTELTPQTYDWSDLVSAGTSLTEPVTFQCNGITQTA